MNEPQKPDAEEFARQTLYHLAAVSAEVYELKLLFSHVLQDLRHRPAAEFQNHYKEYVKKLTGRFYRQSLDASRIGPPRREPEETPPPFPDRGIDPKG